MISPPRIYADWVKMLDMLQAREDDFGVLSAIQQGSLEWQSGVAERFSKRMVEVVNARMNGASDRFQRELSRCQGMESAIVQALLNLRREMSFLTQVVNIPAFPETYRQQYAQLIRNQADKMQSSLEDSARQDRSGKMSSIVRNHKVNVF